MNNRHIVRVTGSRHISARLRAMAEAAQAEIVVQEPGATGRTFTGMIVDEMPQTERRFFAAIEPRRRQKAQWKTETARRYRK